MTIEATMPGTELIGIEFTETEIPHAVYRLYNADWTLLYVGITWNLPQRMDAHSFDKWWWPQVAHRTMVWYGSKLDALKAEAEAIDAENPLRNDMRPALPGVNVPPHGQRSGYHKYPPIVFRPGVKPGDPDGDRDWLAAYATETGRPVSAIVSEALAEYRKRADFANPLRDASVTGAANREITSALNTEEQS